MFDSLAFAMGAPQAGAPAPDGMGMLASFMPFILMFVIFWFLLIRPQQKRAKAHRQMLDNLKRGDKIITQSGLLGTILELDKEELLLECGEAKLRMSRAAIGGVIEPKKGKDDKSAKGEKNTKADNDASHEKNAAE
ncbi:MAG: preprotein translocase subunit YajC [Desulfovibrio sp.]|nr:preprotein translocase subunit YajC [Desulfovibrio sp.]